MNKILSKKSLLILSIFVLVDIIVIFFGLLYIKPDDSVSLGFVLILIPGIFLTNLILGIIIFFLKRYLAIYFVLNAFVSSVILFIFWWLYIRIDHITHTESWNFWLENYSYNIFYTNSENDYDVEIKRNESSSYRIDCGIYKECNDTIYFYSNAGSTYYIYKDYLYNFNGIDKLKLKKIY